MPCVAKKHECDLPVMNDAGAGQDVDLSIATRELDRAQSLYCLDRENTLRFSHENPAVVAAYERYFEEGGKRYSHILDPKTGRPSKTDVASVTIIDKDGARADALCTALFAMGWDKTRDFLRHQPQMKAVVMHADMTQAVVTPAAAAVVTPADDSVKLTTLQ